MSLAFAKATAACARFSGMTQDHSFAKTPQTSTLLAILVPQTLKTILFRVASPSGTDLRQLNLTNLCMCWNSLYLGIRQSAKSEFYPQNQRGVGERVKAWSRVIPRFTIDSAL